MAIGTSGRVVIDLNPAVKKALHEHVRLQGKSLKQWFEEKISEEFPKIVKEQDPDT